MKFFNSEKLIADDILINGKPILCKEVELNNEGDILQEFHFPTRNKDLVKSIFFKHYFFPMYTEEELVYGPGRPISIKVIIKRNNHRTYIVRQVLRFGIV